MTGKTRELLVRVMRLVDPARVFNAGQLAVLIGMAAFVGGAQTAGEVIAAAGAGIAAGNLLTGACAPRDTGGHLYFVQMGRPEWEECPNCGINLVLPGRDTSVRISCPGATITMPPGFTVVMASCATCGMLLPEEA